MIHIGEEIRQELKSQGRSVTWLAKELNYERGNIYKIFRRADISVHLLMKLSVVLDRNFFELYMSEYKENKKEKTGY